MTEVLSKMTGVLRKTTGEMIMERLPDYKDKSTDRLIVMLVLFIVFNTFIMSTTKVSGDSMYPSFKNGERRLMTKYNTSIKSLDHEDVIVFKAPNNNFFIKRVIALDGDTLEIKNNKVYVNDKELDETYVNEFEKMYDIEKFTIDKNGIFVMGDNRDNSMDSRTFGPIHVNSVLGKVLK